MTFEKWWKRYSFGWDETDKGIGAAAYEAGAASMREEVERLNLLIKLAQGDHHNYQVEIGEWMKDYNDLKAKNKTLSEVAKAASYYQDRRDAVNRREVVRDMDEAREHLRAALVRLEKK